MFKNIIIIIIIIMKSSNYNNNNYYYTYFILVEVAKKLQKYKNYKDNIANMNKELIIFFGLYT
jgi:hypothetical protein